VEASGQAEARKSQVGREAALALARSFNKVVATRGKQIVVFDMKKDPPDPETLAAHILGPTGNLRAPAVRRGKTLLVGYHPEAYQHELDT
jgi:arsenate reductase-like glutaredoxin family protein